MLSSFKNDVRLSELKDKETDSGYDFPLQLHGPPDFFKFEKFRFRISITCVFLSNICSFISHIQGVSTMGVDEKEMEFLILDGESISKHLYEFLE